MYNLGDRVRCTGTLATTAGTNTDPTTAYFWFRTPAGVVTTYQYGVDAQLIKSATGIYYVDLDVDTAGIWYYGFYSTGTAKAGGADVAITVLGSVRNGTA